MVDIEDGGPAAGERFSMNTAKAWSIWGSSACPAAGRAIGVRNEVLKWLLCAAWTLHLSMTYRVGKRLNLFWMTDLTERDAPDSAGRAGGRSAGARLGSVGRRLPRAPLRDGRSPE